MLSTIFRPYYIDNETFIPHRYLYEARFVDRVHRQKEGDIYPLSVGFVGCSI